MQHTEEHLRSAYIIAMILLLFMAKGMLQEDSDIKLTNPTQMEERICYYDIYAVPCMNLGENPYQNYLYEQDENRFCSGLFLISCMFIFLFSLQGIFYWIHKFRFICNISGLKRIIDFIQNTDGKKGFFFCSGYCTNN